MIFICENILYIKYNKQLSTIRTTRATKLVNTTDHRLSFFFSITLEIQILLSKLIKLISA